ncbi:putative Endoribonuclease [Klebsormidium nitens]|uniref:Diphthine--ammonia ligase n=1 Tax=Klebsormidium nitens TaxID=105231 RepID=A0A1Y1HZW1_KLENI|nr:putative Endoribonuclease [Klebsormidium nitens]|eukprot:GAQ84195.1 putative Endoribonuclease [Klebsormidium nitens]
MKVVALVSGGKDSCYNMMLCEQHGHEIVALANLLPEDDATDELDSFMYQTVGHQLIAAYATCMGLPLFRRRIRGKSKSQGLQYSATEGDEVEDLQVLLAAVKEAIPDVQAVSSGAIASDYQRLRVENVCSRLGLISLAFMWRREQSGLLSDMVAAGVRAVLVKVAAMGLDPHKHLGRELGAMHPTLERLKTLYGCNLCGEGGEYETLTLDCPLFKHARIVLDETDVIIHSADAFAPVGILHTKKFHLEPKELAAVPVPEARHVSQKGGLVDTNARVERGGAEVIMVEDRAPRSSDEGSGTVSAASEADRKTEGREGVPNVERNEAVDSMEGGSEDDVTVGNVDPDGIFRIRCGHPIPISDGGPPAVPSTDGALSTGQDSTGGSSGGETGTLRASGSGPSSGSASNLREGVSPQQTEGAVRSLLTSAEAELAAQGMTWADVIYVYLFLADMAHFARANAAYKQVITEEKCACGRGVPSRSTVQVELPPGCAAKVEVLVAGVGKVVNGRAVRNESVGVQSGRTDGTGNALEEGKRNDVEAAVMATRGERGSTLADYAGGSAEKGEPRALGAAGGGREERQAGAGEAETREAGERYGCAGEERPWKKVLHVQSISSWAPSCIGPYSQATSYNGRLYMAGMLGLDPATMELVAGGAGAQMARALLSCEAVTQAMGTSARLKGETFTIFHDKKCSEDDLRAVEEELGIFMEGRPSARYIDNFNQTSPKQESEENPLAGSLQPSQRRDLREEVAREMQLELEADDVQSEDAANGVSALEIASEASRHGPCVKYERVPGLPKGALVEVVMVCRVDSM